MKILHAADIHLGSKMDSKFPKEIADVRKVELRNTFRRMVEYAVENGVELILLAGDVFDSDAPFRRDKDFFYSVIRNTPGVDFLYLKGNHDSAADYAEDSLPNLKTFSDQWQQYRYGNVVVSGIEISPENADSMYATLSLKEEDLNLVMLHGQAGDVSGKDQVNIRKLRGKYIDYLALGHIHRPQSGRIDDRGEYAYSGCLEGRGFDEAGEHGFLLLEAGDRLTRRFVPFAERRIVEESVDITDVKDAYAAYQKVKEQVAFNKKDIYRIRLVGETDYDVEGLNSDVAKSLSDDCFFADVKDQTAKKLDLHIFDGDPTLRGEFVRSVSGNPEYTEEEKKRIIAVGLKALNGENIEL